jgi:hypothetical protein
MQTFVPLSEQTGTPAPGPNDLVFVDVAPAASTESDSVESLRNTLKATELRLAYFERFGPWVEEQMAAVVERASSLERAGERVLAEATGDAARLRAEAAEEVAGMRRDAEHERQAVAAEIARSRQELEELKAECERQREEAKTTVAQAHKTAEFVMGRLNESADGIVQRALADFESLRRELTPEALAATAECVPASAESTEGTDAVVQEEDPKRGWRPFGK